MKRKIYSLLLVVIAFFFCSCSDEYLDTVPTSSTGEATVFENTDYVKYAVNGLARLMTNQYLSTQGFNGEGAIKMFYGNYPGANFYTYRTGYQNTITLKQYNNYTTRNVYYPWGYYYMLISNANNIIHKVDDATGTESDKNYLKAQALGFRAYAYTMLMQLYTIRGVDSNNGTTNGEKNNGVILRTELTTQDNIYDGPATPAQVYQQIYDDCDEAIRLFQASDYVRGNDAFYEVNENVIYAIYTRAALNRQDYDKVLETAPKARSGYPLMTWDEYKAGFSTQNQEWIWGSYASTDQHTAYYSFQSYIAYNSSSSAVRSTPACISKDLYDQIPSTDKRKSFFLGPLSGETYSTTHGRATANSAIDKRARSLYPDIDATGYVFAYMQFKFSCFEQPGVGNLNHFRSSEMILSEAEARYFKGDEQGARSLLIELNKTSGRDPNYDCTLTGSALFDEIKKYRHFELWGEGFDWFDLKRWKDASVRRSFTQGGNFYSAFAGTIEPDSENHFDWTFWIPYDEQNYNEWFD